MMIRALDEDVRSLLRSGIAVSSLTQCIDELVVNSLDAGATCITVHLDIPAFRLQVSDNGTGICRENLDLLGERYSTSKCHSLTDLNNIKFYGFRGEAVASIRDIAGNLEIVTRHKSSYKTYCKTFKTGQVAAITEACIPRSNVGTTVTVYDIFSTLPVRRKLVSDVLEIERIRQRLASIALINPSVSFSLYNDITGQKCLQSRKCKSVVSTFSQLFGNLKAKNLHEVKGIADNVKVSGYVGLQTHNSKSLQFVYINGRLVIKTRIHKLVNHILNKSLLIKKPALSNDNTETESVTSPPKQASEKYGIFVLNITCPFTAYDITLEPAKTLVEFEDWEKVLCAIKGCVESFLMDKNMILRTDVTDDAVESQDSCDSQIDLSVYEYQADITKHDYCIDARNIRKSLHSSVVSRKPKQDSNTSQNIREHDVLIDHIQMQHKRNIGNASVILQTTKKDGEKTKTSTPSLQIPGKKTPLSVPGKTLTIASKSKGCCFTSPNPITLKTRRSFRRVHFGSTKKSRNVFAHDGKGERSSAEHNMDQSIKSNSKENNRDKSDLDEHGLNEYNANKDQITEFDTEKHDNDVLAADNPTYNNYSNWTIASNTSTTSHMNKANTDSKVSLVDEGDDQEENIPSPISLQLHGSDTDRLVVDESVSLASDKCPVTSDDNTCRPVVDNSAPPTVIEKCQIICDRHTVTGIITVSSNYPASFDSNTKRPSMDDSLATGTDNCYQVRHDSNINGVSNSTVENCPVKFDRVSTIIDNSQLRHDSNKNSVSNVNAGNCPGTFDRISTIIDNSQLKHGSNKNSVLNVNAGNCPGNFDRISTIIDNSQFRHDSNKSSVSNMNAGNSPGTFNRTSTIIDNSQLRHDSNMNSVSNRTAGNCPGTFNDSTVRPVADISVSKDTNVCQALNDSSTNSIADKVAENCPKVTDLWQSNNKSTTCSTQLPKTVADSSPIKFKNATNRRDVDNSASKVSDLWQTMFDSNMNKTIYYNVNTGNTVFECPYSQGTASQVDDTVARDGVSGVVPLVCAAHVSFDCTPWLPRNDRHKRTSNQENEEQYSSHVSKMLDQWVNPVFESSSEMDVTSLSMPATARASLYKAILPYRFTKAMVKDLHVIQQVDNKFIICQVQQDNSENDLFNTTTQSDKPLPSIKSSPVSPPIEIDFTPNDLLLIKRFRGELGRVGVKFVIGCSSESIERRSIIVHELPCVFVEREVSETRRRRPSVAVSIVKDLVESHIEHLRQTNGVSPAIPKTISRVLSSQACHGAIKFGDTLTVQECQQLLQQLSTCDLPFQCAHGRPSIIPLFDLKLLESMHFPIEVDQKPRLNRITKAFRN